MARNQGRKAKIYIFFDLWPNFACCYAPSFNHLSILPLFVRPAFFFLSSGDARRGGAEAQQLLSRLAAPHPRWFMVDLDPVKRSKATPSSNK